MSPQTPTPDDDQSIFEALLALAPDLLAGAEAVLAPISAARGDLRARLLDDGSILPIPTGAAPAVETMAAIDGARVTEKLYGADLLVAVATTADALSAARTLPTATSAWAEIVTHMPEIDKVVGVAMAMLEIRLAARAEHQYRLLDGSFQSPVVEFIQGLSVSSSEIRRRVTDILDAHDVAAALAALLSHDPARPVLALPKSEVSHHYGKIFADRYGLPEIGVTDRVLATQVLEPGEMLAPRTLREWNGVEPRAHSEASALSRRVAGELRDAVAAMKTAAVEGTVATFYLKPAGASGTVVRVEHHRDGPDDDVTSGRYAALIVAETRAPHAIEPFAQWAVDRRAKAISRGTQALRASTLARMTPEQMAAWGWQIARNYRT